MVVWLIGLAGAGKTTIGREVVSRLRSRNRATVFIDGDAMRAIMGEDLGHTVEDRRHPHNDVGYRQGALENLGAVGFGENRLLHPFAHLATVDIKGCHDLDVARPPITDPGMHEAGKRSLVPSLVVF